MLTTKILIFFFIKYLNSTNSLNRWDIQNKVFLKLLNNLIPLLCWSVKVTQFLFLSNPFIYAAVDKVLMLQTLEREYFSLLQIIWFNFTTRYTGIYLFATVFTIFMKIFIFSLFYLRDLMKRDWIRCKIFIQNSKRNDFGWMGKVVFQRKIVSYVKFCYFRFLTPRGRL